MKKSISALVCPHCGHVEENQQLCTDGLWLAMTEQPYQQCPECEGQGGEGMKMKWTKTKIGGVEAKIGKQFGILKLRAEIRYETPRDYQHKQHMWAVFIEDPALEQLTTANWGNCATHDEAVEAVRAMVEEWAVSILDDVALTTDGKSEEAQE